MPSITDSLIAYNDFTEKMSVCTGNIKQAPAFLQPMPVYFSAILTNVLLYDTYAEDTVDLL